MSDTAIAQRSARAKRSAEANIKKRVFRAHVRAKGVLEKAGYSVFDSNDKPFSLIGTREKEIRFIRILIDEQKNIDFKSIKEYNLPMNCTAELWVKNYDAEAFLIREIYRRGS